MAGMKDETKFGYQVFAVEVDGGWYIVRRSISDKSETRWGPIADMKTALRLKQEVADMTRSGMTHALGHLLATAGMAAVGKEVEG